MTPTFKNILRNFGWLFFDKVVRFGIGIWVMALIARYLGPELLGKYNYAYSFVALFIVIATLGIDTIVVRELVKGSFEKGEILGTSLKIRFFSGILAMLLSVLSIWLIRHSDTQMIVLVALFSIWLPLTSFDVFDFLFQSQYKNKVPVIIRNFAFLVASFGRLWVVFAEKPITWLVLWFVFEIAIAGLGLFLAFKFGKTDFKKLTFSKLFLVKLMRDSWPLALAGALTTVYIRIDQIMIGQILNDQAVGYYSAAVRLSEVWYFVPIIIGSAVMPALIEAHKSNKQLFHKQFKLYYGILAWAAIALSVVVLFMGKHLVFLLYGESFTASNSVLQLHIWASLFVFLGVANSQYLTIENFTQLAMRRALFGTISNVVLNFFLIPKYGINGAAWATLISYFISVYYVLIPKQSREHGLLMLQVLVPWQVPWIHLKVLFTKK